MILNDAGLAGILCSAPAYCPPAPPVTPQTAGPLGDLARRLAALSQQAARLAECLAALADGGDHTVSESQAERMARLTGEAQDRLEEIDRHLRAPGWRSEKGMA